MTEPREPRLLLDAIPDEPLAPVRGRRRALGRDPFADAEASDPALERVVQASAARPAAGRRRAGGPPRLSELGPPPTGRAGGLDPRHLAALDHLVPPGRRTDAFGLSPAALRTALPAAFALYRRWFRVRSEGHAHLPATGPCVLVANHGGLLPFDGAMGVLDVWLHTDPPRLPRALVDPFAQRMPLVGPWFARLGQVPASRRNFRQLLRRGELVWVFPEGMAAIHKPITQRYRLQPFRPGFVEEALRARVPVVPVAILGPDDQAPILADLRPVARRLGLPTLPITPTFPWLGPLGLLPYPVSYRIVYGPPLDLADGAPPGAADDPDRVRALAADVRRLLQRRIDRLRSGAPAPTSSPSGSA